MLVSSMLKVLMMASCTLVFGQRSHGQWVRDLYFTTYETAPPYGNFLIDETNCIVEQIPELLTAAKFTDSGQLNGFFDSLWYNNTLYSYALWESERNEDGSCFYSWLFAKWHENEWFPLGFFRTGCCLMRAIPCDTNRFIAVFAKEGLAGNIGLDSRSPFVRMPMPISGEKELRLGNSIDHGQNDLREYMSDPGCFGLAFFSYIAMTDGYATLVSPNTGLYWVFSLEKANLVKAGNIFRKIRPEMIAKGGFTKAVLCVNPEKSGTVLISACDEDIFITKADDMFKDYYKFQNEFYDDLEKTPLAYPQERVDAFMRARNEMLDRIEKEFNDRNQFIVWYRLYPESGKVEKLAAPPEGGSMFREGGKNDVWRPMPDGSVLMGWHEGMLNTQSKSDQKDKSATETAIKSVQVADDFPIADNGQR